MHAIPYCSIANDQIGLNGVTALTNGNYVVCSQLSHNGSVSVNNAGAVTWGNGSTGTVGVVGAANSLVGSKSNDNVGVYGGSVSGVTALTNGNYVVSSPGWYNASTSAFGAGAATWCDASDARRFAPAPTEESADQQQDKRTRLRNHLAGK